MQIAYSKINLLELIKVKSSHLYRFASTFRHKFGLQTYLGSRFVCSYRLVLVASSSPPPACEKLLY